MVKHNPNINIRRATEADLAAIVELRSVGFEREPEDVRQSFLNDPRNGFKDVIIADIGGVAAGTACMFPAQMWLSGVPLSLGAIAEVTTHPEHRGQGVAFAMIQALLEKMYADGQVISALFTHSHAVYRRQGYIVANLMHTYRLAPHNLITTEESQYVRSFTPDDLPALRSLYRGSQLSQADGRLARTTEWWDRLVAEPARSGKNAILVYDNGAIEGYLKCRLEEEGVLRVVEMFYAGDAAYRGLWSYLATRANIKQLVYDAPADDPLLYLLRSPGEASESLPPAQIYDTRANCMMRVVNVAEALTARFYPHDMMGNRIIQVNDPQLPANNTLLQFRIVDGRPDLSSVAEGTPPDIQTDIVTFSQMYLGFLPPAVARQLGRLQADDDSVTWLSQAMALSPLFIHRDDWF